jgi:hypothetical protein
MRRPEQHVVETKAERIFENIIPPEWVARRLSHDYGIDYAIEVFESGQSTGKTFFVQLKGSSQRIIDSTFKKQFSSKNLKYYASQPLPVLILFVSVNTEQVWCIWANNLLRAYDVREKQKYLSISLDENYLITRSSFHTLASDINKHTKFGISINFRTEAERLLNNSIINWINHFYSDTISIKFNHLPKHIELSYTTVKDTDIIFSIKSSDFAQDVVVKGILRRITT